MSYNISDWRTKILDALSLPLASLYDLMPDLITRGWRPEDPVITAMTPEASRSGYTEGTAYNSTDD